VTRSRGSVIPTRRAVTAALATTMLTTRTSIASSCGTPTDIEDGWAAASPQDAGLDADRLCTLVRSLDGIRNGNIHSIIVARHGSLVFDHYRKGNDQTWDQMRPNAEHGPTIKHDLRSATKSIVSLLIGIALDRKLIASIDEPIFSYFPEYAALSTPEKANIAIRHLLTMSSGLEWNENLPYTDPHNSEMAMLRSGDRLRFALQPPLVATPGIEWNYSGGCTELLGAVLSKISRKTIEEFANENLFTPIGIREWNWARYPDNIAAAASGLQLRPRDLAKIGQLVLQRGRWGGTQVVSEQWIADATAPQIGMNDRVWYYGYQWWLGRSLVNRKEVSWIAAHGLGGQRLFIVPKFDLVCLVMAGHYTDAMQHWLPLLLFNKFLLSAVR